MSRRRNKSRVRHRPSKRAQQALAEQRAKISASSWQPRRIVDDGPSLLNLSDDMLDMLLGPRMGPGEFTITHSEPVSTIAFSETSLGLHPRRYRL